MDTNRDVFHENATPDDTLNCFFQDNEQAERMAKLGAEDKEEEDKVSLKEIKTITNTVTRQLPSSVQTSPGNHFPPQDRPQWANTPPTLELKLVSSPVWL